MEALLPSLTRAEKEHLLGRVVEDLGLEFPGVEITAGVCGGEPRIVRTRIPVWVLERARRSGAGERELLDAYPSLRHEDLVNAWVYSRANAAEIDRQILENDAA